MKREILELLEEVDQIVKSGRETGEFWPIDELESLAAIVRKQTEEVERLRDEVERLDMENTYVDDKLGKIEDRMLKALNALRGSE